MGRQIKGHIDGQILVWWAQNKSYYKKLYHVQKTQRCPRIQNIWSDYRTFVSTVTCYVGVYKICGTQLCMKNAALWHYL